VADVGQRVAIEHLKIGELSDLQRADVLSLADRLGAVQRGHTQRLVVGEAAGVRRFSRAAITSHCRCIRSPTR